MLLLRVECVEKWKTDHVTKCHKQFYNILPVIRLNVHKMRWRTGKTGNWATVEGETKAITIKQTEYNALELWKRRSTTGAQQQKKKERRTDLHTQTLWQQQPEQQQLGAVAATKHAHIHTIWVLLFTNLYFFLQFFFRLPLARIAECHSSCACVLVLVCVWVCVWGSKGMHQNQSHRRQHPITKSEYLRLVLLTLTFISALGIEETFKYVFLT